MSLVLRAKETEIVHSHLCRAYPEEGCGVLLGHEREGTREVVRVVPLDNLREDARSNRYLIAPEQLLAVDRSAREAGLEVLGFFHSHPDHPPEPSGFDREHAWPWYSYLIVAVERGRNAGQRAWRLREDRSAFDEEPIETPPGGDGAIR
jgi:proteasome lid subunit RPN8/RPN11